MKFKFNSEVSLRDDLYPFSQAQIKGEPMLHKCDLEHASNFGGPITHAFILALCAHWDVSTIGYIDSRAHMLMPGWWPCIPGYHHDDVPRDRSDGQPDYHAPKYHSEHCMALFGDCCPTEFALGESEFPDVPIGSIYYKEWHPQVIWQLSTGQLKRFDCPSEKLVFFDWQTWHQGTPAKKNGWRFFIRATRFSDHKPKNEIRRQSQVYLSNPMEGW